MRLLCVDVGTGTQDILLFDSHLDLENAFKMVVPSPTMMVHRRLKEATQRGVPVLLHGVTMGGGPSQWAAEAHLRAGLPLYATPAAARSFNDDLDAVAALGVTLVSEDEAAALPDSVERIALRDFDFAAIAAAFARFGVSLGDLDAVAVAVFDHGAAPPGVSDRQFRFEYLAERIRAENRLTAFAFPADRVPPIMTRMQAVVHSAREVDAPLLVMDTAPAAVLGATFDPLVRRRARTLVVNVGNFHTLAFRLGPTGIEGLFEHHTGLLTQVQLERLLTRLADGTLTHHEVFADHGHGALVLHPEPLPLPADGFGVVVTGPRRGMLHGSRLRPHFAVPFGDMMISGCFGLLAAAADHLPHLAEAIHAALTRQGDSGTAPWDTAG